MARTGYVTVYPPIERHREEVRALRRSRRLRLAVAVPASVLVIFLAANWSAPLATLLAGVAALVVFFLALPGSTSVDAGQLSGVEGEAAVLERLGQLPDDYTLLNRVKLPDETLTNGQRELDFIVAGPTGLWVIEVKNTPGHIRVRPDDKHWPLARRSGCGSQPSWNAMPNPIPQTRSQVEALDRWLLKQGVNARARAMVVLSHPEVALSDADQSPVPVLLREEVASHIQQAEGSPVGRTMLTALAQLRA